ncbi:MAG TPA: hypothetical protein VFC72_02005, partial [Corynebacterium sp.]|nr:hypothetical protein [Corynebacterium sp.]
AAAQEANEEQTGNPKIRDLSSRLHTFGSYTPGGAPAAEPEPATEVIPQVSTAPEEASEEQPADSHPPTGSTPHLAVASDATEEPEQLEGGFGSRGYTRSGTAVLVLIAFVFVFLIAAATTFLAGLIGGDREQAPVTTDSIQGSQQDASPRPLPILQDIAEVSLWQAPGQDPTADNPSDTVYLIDEDTDTRWSSDTYPQGLGTKPGIGLALTTADAVLLDHLLVQSPSAGTRFSVYALPEGGDPATVSDLTELPRVAEGELHTGRNNLDLAEDTRPAGGVIFWITELPGEDDDDAVIISEISVVGRGATPETLEDARESAEREAEATAPES